MTVPLLIDAGEAVTLRALLIALRDLLAWLVVVGLVAVVVAFVYAILWPLNKVVSAATFGVVGSVPGTHAVEQAVTSALGSAVAQLDKQVGAFWHALKTIVNSVGSEILGLGILAGYLAWYITKKLSLAVIHRLTHQAISVAHDVGKVARSAEQDALHAERYAKAQVRQLDRRITAIPGTVEGVLQPEIKSARDLAKSAEDLATAAWDYLKSHPWTVVTDAFIGAVAIALGKLGLDWIKCDSAKSFFQKAGCGFWKLLEDAFGILATLALAIFSVLKPQDLAEAAVAAVDTIEPILQEILNN